MNAPPLQPEFVVMAALGMGVLVGTLLVGFCVLPLIRLLDRLDGWLHRRGWRGLTK